MVFNSQENYIYGVIEMKITGANSYIILDIDGWKIRVLGERVVGGFIAEKKTMQRFEPPYENVLLSEDVKRMYINGAINKTLNSHMVLQFI